MDMVRRVHVAKGKINRSAKEQRAKKREKAERAALTAAWERALGSRDSGRLLLFCGDPPPIFTIQRFTRAMLGRLPAGG